MNHVNLWHWGGPMDGSLEHHMKIKNKKDMVEII